MIKKGGEVWHTFGPLLWLPRSSWYSWRAAQQQSHLATEWATQAYTQPTRNSSGISHQKPACGHTIIIIIVRKRGRRWRVRQWLWRGNKPPHSSVILSNAKSLWNKMTKLCLDSKSLLWSVLHNAVHWNKAKARYTPAGEEAVCADRAELLPSADGNASRALSWAAHSVQDQLTCTLDAPIFIRGDLNRCNLKNMLLDFEQHIKYHTTKPKNIRVFGEC